MNDNMPPYQRHSDTSKAAAEAIKPSASSLRRRVFQHLIECGIEGATDEQIAIALDMPGNTQRPRRTELLRSGLVVEQGKKRKTTSGRAAKVWRVRYPATGDGLQGCPCPHCGSMFKVSSWSWVAMQCPTCKGDVSNPLEASKRGRKSRAAKPSGVELRVYVSPEEAQNIREAAHMKGMSVSTYLRFCFEDRQRLLLSNLGQKDLHAENRALIAHIKQHELEY